MLHFTIVAGPALEPKQNAAPPQKIKSSPVLLRLEVEIPAIQLRERRRSHEASSALAVPTWNCSIRRRIVEVPSIEIHETAKEVQVSGSFSREDCA